MHFLKLYVLNLNNALFSKKFSLVIGNPPFVTMYGKRSRNMTEEKRAYYNTFDFVQWSRIGYSYSNWSMGVHEKRYNLDQFLNTKYYIQT